jgi:hypothetical protein
LAPSTKGVHPFSSYFYITYTNEILLLSYQATQNSNRKNSYLSEDGGNSGLKISLQKKSMNSTISACDQHFLSYQWDKVRVNSPLDHHPAHLSLVTENQVGPPLVQDNLQKNELNITLIVLQISLIAQFGVNLDFPCFSVSLFAA